MTNAFKTHTTASEGSKIEIKDDRQDARFGKPEEEDGDGDFGFQGATVELQSGTFVR